MIVNALVLLEEVHEELTDFGFVEKDTSDRKSGRLIQ